MAKEEKIVFTLEEKSIELNNVMVKVRKQVLRYEAAKKAGTLKKINQVASKLFNA